MTDPRPAPQPRFDVQVDWDARIVVRDGTELSANIWRPVARDEGPARFPAILEMIPYGKDNWRRNADTTRGEWFAARGFALCRLDVRGTGSSGGVALDEYTADETRDGFDAVEWLAGQPWCSGDVGMWGISYGGFTSIQVAMLRPPHLRAIVPVMATDDRYLDDVHYRGGCVTVSELSQYAVSQVAMNAMPPDASFRGLGWRDEWRRRLEATPPWLFAWLRHQTDGPYWRQGSLAPDYGAIDVPILNIGGWHDSYVDPAFRMQARCPASSHTLVGNWVHSWPHDAYPGPNLDELHEIARFFERHLDGVDNGWDDEPAVVWFEHEYTSPVPFPASLPGRWRAASAYPHPATTVRTWAFGRGSLAAAGAPDEGIDVFRHRPTTGTSGPLSWGAGDAPNGLARDLRPDEADGPTYTSEPLAEALEVLGVPEVVVHLEVDAPVATLSVRLSDVAPDGTSALVSAGVLSLTHRRSHADPEPLRAGVVEEIRVALRTAGYRWLPGHRVRVALSSSAVARPLAIPLPRHVPRSSRGDRSVPARASGRAARRRRGRSARARLPDRTADAAMAIAGVRRRRRLGRRRIHPSGRSSATCSTARSTVQFHDGGEDDRPRRPTAVRRGDPPHDGVGRRPGTRRARRGRRLSMAGARSGAERRADPDRDPRRFAGSGAPSPTSTCRSASRSTSTATASSSASWRETIPRHLV